MGVHLGQAKWKSRRYANKDAENVATYAAPLRLLCLLIRKCAIWRSPNRCRAQLAKTLRHVAVLKRRVADLQARIANNTELSQKHKERARAFRHRIAIQSEQLAQALDKNASQRRSMLSKRVIRQHLPLRASVTRARVDGPARETTFLEASAAYAEALAAAASPPGDPRLLHTDLLGLHWWVPILRKGDDLPSSAWLVKQRFPYRVITQTRELGLGGIMLDLGANLGRMSISRVLLGDVTAAYCAEPDPVNYACLVRNIVSNGLRGLVLADCVAIGAAQGFARMRVGRWSGAHSLAGC